MVPREIYIKMVARRPIFEKCPHLREKGGVLTLRTPHWVCADPCSNRDSTIPRKISIVLYQGNRSENYVDTDLQQLLDTRTAVEGRQ